MKDTELHELLSKVRYSDKEAFACVYNDLKKPVFTIICRIVQSKTLAEDVTQDAFMKLFLSPPDSSVRNPRAWIFRVARNLAIDALRKKQCTDIDDVAEAGTDFADNSILRMDIDRAMSSLPRDEREIITLHLNGGLSFAQTAEIVGLSVASTYRKYRSAIKCLRDYLNGGAL